jgi:hypothetical protein
MENYSQAAVVFFCSAIFHALRPYNASSIASLYFDLISAHAKDLADAFGDGVLRVADSPCYLLGVSVASDGCPMRESPLDR